MLEIDPLGLIGDRLILLTIIEKFDGGPVGVETLAAAIGEETETIEDVHEPFLMQRYAEEDSPGTDGHRSSLSVLQPHRRPRF